MNGEHGEIVALLGVADEIMDGLRHPFNQVLGGELASLNGEVYHIEDTLNPKHPAAVIRYIGVCRFGQSVSKEQNGGLGLYDGRLRQI